MTEAPFYCYKNNAWTASAWKRLALIFGVALWCVLPVAAENVLFAPDPDRTGAENGVWSASLAEPGRRNAAVIPVPVDRIAGKKVILAAEVEQRDISEKPNHWNGVKLVLELTCADGKKNYPQALNSPGSLSWMPRGVSATVPPDIRSAQIHLGLESVSGTVRFRNVRILEDVPVDHGKYLLTGFSNKDDGDYQPGEEMVFTFRLTEDGKASPGWVRVVCSGDDGKSKTSYMNFDESGSTVARRTLNQPGYVMTKATLLTTHGIPAKTNGRDIQYGLGGGVATDTLKQGVPEPEGFDAYWESQKKRLATVPMKVLEKKFHKETDRCRIYDMKISCVGKRPVSGYLAVPKNAPKNAKAKSLPLRIRFEGYGISSPPIEEHSDKITFVVNPHGIENGREKAYYDGLAKGELSSYGFDKNENQKPETCYFNDMILRGLRALEFGRSLPEWDGKTVFLTGGSQGALQVVAVAGLSEGISGCFIRVPWFCDLGGIRVGRIRGWRPDFMPPLGFFDTVNFAKRVECPVEIEAGLSDWVCPPSGVRILYNNLRSHAKLTMFQGLDHGGYPGYNAQKTPKIVYHK